MGRYSPNISRKIAIQLVNNKNHPALSKFANTEMKFWFAYGVQNLHYGRGHLEGTIPLNDKGKKYYLKNKEKWN